MVWFSRWGEAKQRESFFLHNSSSPSLWCYMLPAWAAPAQSSGSRTDVTWWEKHGEEEGRGGGGGKEARHGLKAPKRCPSEVKKMRKKQKTKAKIKAELFSSTSKWLTLKPKLLFGMWKAAVHQEREVDTDGGRNDESKERSWMKGGGSLRGECRHGRPMSSRQWKPLPASSSVPHSQPSHASHLPSSRLR